MKCGANVSHVTLLLYAAQIYAMCAISYKITLACHMCYLYPTFHLFGPHIWFLTTRHIFVMNVSYRITYRNSAMSQHNTNVCRVILSLASQIFVICPDRCPSKICNVIYPVVSHRMWDIEDHRSLWYVWYRTLHFIFVRRETVFHPALPVSFYWVCIYKGTRCLSSSMLPLNTTYTLRWVQGNKTKVVPEILYYLFFNIG
jgi:hypothetical protein